MPPGLEWLRVAMERLLVDATPAQHNGVEKVLQDFAAEIIIGDDMFFGVLPMLLGPRSKRPPVVLCGTSILHWRRADGAPHFIGLQPATTPPHPTETTPPPPQHNRVVHHPSPPP